MDRNKPAEAWENRRDAKGVEKSFETKRNKTNDVSTKNVFFKWTKRNTENEKTEREHKLHSV